MHNKFQNVETNIINVLNSTFHIVTVTARHLMLKAPNAQGTDAACKLTQIIIAYCPQSIISIILPYIQECHL